MKSDVRAGQLRAASDPRHMKHWPYTLTLMVFSREPNPLIMTGELKPKGLHFYLFTTTSLTGKGENGSLLKYMYSCPQR